MLPINEKVMRYRRRRRGLFLWRTALCLCLLLLLFVAARGTTAVIKGISGSVPATSAQEGSSGSEPSAPSQVPAAVPDPPASLPPGNAPSPESGPEAPDAKPGSWFDDALFIGDSRTEALRNYGGLGDATYYAVKGLMVNTVYTRREISVHGTKKTVMQAAASRKYGKIYIMLGVNELGWSSMQTFVSDYKTMVRDLKKDQPEARIYLQSILPVTAKKSADSKIYNNDKIASYNSAIRKIAKGENVTFLNIAEAVSSGGVLPDDASGDGVHLNSAYCAKWCDYLKTHTD